MTQTKDLKILIIDDEPDIRDILAALLEDIASKIDLASDGAEGIGLIGSNDYDIILSDQKMPKKTGVEVLRWMREQNINTPFVIQTGYDQTDVRAQAEQLGVYSIIGKPWDEEGLIKLVLDATKKG